MNDLTERLIPNNSPNLGRNGNSQQPNRYRMTLLYEKGKNDFDSGFEYESWQKEKKMYHSIIEEPDLEWNSEQIMERTLLLEEPQNQIQNKEGEQQVAINNSIATNQSKLKSNYSIKQSNIAEPDKPKSKQLNHRIFNMGPGPQKCLYYFNIIFSFFFRAGLVVLLIELIIKGDGDSDKNQQTIFISILLGLEGLVALLYFLALTKMLYTKSSDISVHFQKQFYEKPYAQIHMERILRKHFTLQKMVSNLCRLANPFTKFSKDIRISIMRQEIYKRIELIIIFVPLAVMFIMGTPWFNKDNEIEFKFDVKLLLAIVVCLESCRFTIHYIIIYIFS